MAVSIAAPTSTSVPAGSSVALASSVSNDSKNGGVTWGISAGCGTLTNVTTTSATYNAPAAATLDATCTATITATSVSDTSKASTLALTAKAITVSVSSSAGTTTTFGSGAAAVTLTATLNNEATGASDPVKWSLVPAATESARRPSRSVHRNIVGAVTCGTLTPSTTNPEQATWTSPSSLGSNCTATITAASTINSNQTMVTTFTVDEIIVAIATPAAAVTEYDDKGAVGLTATIANDAANKGLTWALTAGSCGSIGGAGTSATYTPPVAPASPCTATATATSVTDPSQVATSPLITINPNIQVGLGAVPSTLNEGAQQSLTANISNDLNNGGLAWTLNPTSGCGSLSGSGATVTYTAGPSLAATCTAVVKVSSVTDSTQSATASIVVTPTTVAITLPTGAQQVTSSTVTALTASIQNDGSGQGISWTISPATGCGMLSPPSGTSINYTAPAEPPLAAACTATITAASTDDSTKKSAPVQITANPIAMSAITSGTTGITLPASVWQASPGIQLSASVSYDAAGGNDISWSMSPLTGCGSLGTPVVAVGGNTSTNGFTPPNSVAGTVPCVATITATSLADGSRKSSTTITVTPLAISISPSGTAYVNLSGTQQLTATISKDVLSQGVNWSLNPATGCGSLFFASGASGSPNTFTAPATPCTATATATSVSDGTKTASVGLTVTAGISVALSPAGPLNIDGNSPLSIMPTVNNDSAGLGVIAALNPPTGCGTLSGLGAGNKVASGIAFNYNPPASSTCAVAIVATSQSDGTRSATLNLNVYPSLNLTGTLGLATQGLSYSGSLTAGGGNGTYTWTVTPLSNGLSSSATGNTLTITGAPIAGNPVSFQASVKDSTGTTIGPNNYTITVSPYTLVSLPSVSLPGTTVGQQGYSASITASNGVPSYTFTVNGTPVGSTAGLLTGGGGLSGVTNGSVLTISGTPSGPAGPISLAVSVMDGEGHIASNTYSVSVNSGATLSSQIFENNNCDSNLTQPTFTVTLSNSSGPVGTPQTTDVNGNFSFAGIPDGTYTITPSITGPSSVFYPASQTVTVSGGVATPNLQTTTVSLGYTVSGTVSYAPGTAKPIYISLNNNNCGSGNSGPGTSIVGPGSFTIRGVGPGSYSLQSVMDTLGNGAPNANDPSGSTSVSVSNANATGVSVTLNSPSTITFTSNPSINSVNPTNLGALLVYTPVATQDSNGNQVEQAASYTVQYSTNSSFTGALTKTFPATGTHGTNFWILSGLTNSQKYYFRAMGTAPGATDSGWSNTGSAVIGASTTGYKVTGTVNFTGTATGPLYVGFFDQNANIPYVAVVASPTTGVGFTVYVPAVTNSYYFFGIIDQNNDGVVDAGDITNTNSGNDNANVVTISGATAEPALTLPSSNSNATLTTNHSKSTNPGSGGGPDVTNENYSLNFDVRGVAKIPVIVTVTSGPNVIAPQDFSLCSSCDSAQVNFSVGINGARPTVAPAPDSYDLSVTYSDGSSDTETVTVGAVLDAFVTNLSPVDIVAGDTTPTFTWTYPANASDYTYSFNIYGGNNWSGWQIPGNNSKSNGFSSSAVTSIIYPTDPTDSTNTASPSSLTTGQQYNWQISAQDSNGNSAQQQVYFIP